VGGARLSTPGDAPPTPPRPDRRASLPTPSSGQRRSATSVAAASKRQCGERPSGQAGGCLCLPIATAGGAELRTAARRGLGRWRRPMPARILR
jgi:hypothetical protein